MSCEGCSVASLDRPLPTSARRRWSGCNVAATSAGQVPSWANRCKQSSSREVSAEMPPIILSRSKTLSSSASKRRDVSLDNGSCCEYDYLHIAHAYAQRRLQMHAQVRGIGEEISGTHPNGSQCSAHSWAARCRLCRRAMLPKSLVNNNRSAWPSCAPPGYWKSVSRRCCRPRGSASAVTSSCVCSGSPSTSRVRRVAAASSAGKHLHRAPTPAPGGSLSIWELRHGGRLHAVYRQQRAAASCLCK